ncbi:MAG: hypothetical protein QG602_4111 [Verrucomicrobiota bacterium]|nr:hypothetical protein [Verrucomicrobiota bacterium]
MLITEIARKTKVSSATVSRAINPNLHWFQEQLLQVQSTNSR